MIDLRRNNNFIDKDDMLAREIIKENTGGKDPELTLVEEFLEELDLRLEQVKVYYPFMEMLRKRKKEEESSRIIPELCFLSLSYLIYEGKLKHRGITFEDLQAFLNKALQRIMNRKFAQEELQSLTADILDGLQNGGRNFVIETYSFITGKFREKYVKFLEIKQSGEGVLQYYITEQGVDFYLRTKEFPEETKITINLLLFQKQMEKGAFGFAYETVRRLNMEVQKKKDRKYSLLESLMYGLNDSGEAYHNYHHSIVMQFEEEAELFGVAIKNVRSVFDEYVERINNGEATDKEKSTFTLIKIIEKEIGRAQTLHTQLLKEAVGFTREYDQALGVRRKAIFTERFNFQGEFEKLVKEDAQPEALKFLFEPLLKPYVRKSFNPLRALESQRLVKSCQVSEESQDHDVMGDRETIDQITSKRVRKNFVFYASRLLEELCTSEGQVTLREFCSRLMERYSEDTVYNGDFLSFLLALNRDKQIGQYSRTIDFANVNGQMDEELKTIEEVFLKASLSKSEAINQVTVKSFPEEEVELLPGLKITNMIFRGERI
ncbi:hypothetical protein [Phosphitispora sp. TUW77]|uniref:hypothetical protein n=1 Tax=Phosphitispora sp. TUW77 TaxID=3152361 RepID=UPI003AB3BFCE